MDGEDMSYEDSKSFIDHEPLAGTAEMQRVQVSDDSARLSFTEEEFATRLIANAEETHSDNNDLRNVRSYGDTESTTDTSSEGGDPEPQGLSSFARNHNRNFMIHSVTDNTLSEDTLESSKSEAMVIEDSNESNDDADRDMTDPHVHRLLCPQACYEEINGIRDGVLQMSPTWNGREDPTLDPYFESR